MRVSGVDSGHALDDVIRAGDAEDANKVLALGLDSQYTKFLSGAGYALSAGADRQGRAEFEGPCPERRR